ncbi:hypothetical protein [Alkalihalobacterium alkalinitrilicum]|uniref:hypothetical protein n=1 Tax=Alkalihalobacterium alkalinitrilicum TaxID=427920 RepID=UPI0009958115|nr:hypothetical protein [Alkalihalobacterium alkalinitrilicum]
MFKNRTITGKIIGFSGFLIFLVGMFFLIGAIEGPLPNTLLIVGVIGILSSNFFRIKKGE